MPDDSTLQSTQTLERRLTTILCADVAGYSKMVAANEERTVQVFQGHREIFESLVALHRGRIFNTAGDSLLAEFKSAVEAVRCATEIQTALHTRNEHLSPEEKMQFRIGINLGDVIVQGGDLLGDGVNVAARIQAATAPGCICISGSVYDQIQNKLSLKFKLRGEQKYKNIPNPVRTYTVNEFTSVATPPRRTLWRVLTAITATLVIAGGGYWGYIKYEMHQTKSPRVDTRLADQLTVQKRPTEKAPLKTEVTKPPGQLPAQKQAMEEKQSRAIEEHNKIEQERIQLEKERKRIEAEKQAAEASRKQIEESQRAASIALKESAKVAPSHDGFYNGQLCNQFSNKEPVCWSVTLVVRNGMIEGSWISPSKNMSRALGTIASDGSVQLNLAGWTRSGTPAVAKLVGRMTDDTIIVSGQWMDGNEIAGDWKRKP